MATSVVYASAVCAEVVNPVRALYNDCTAEKTAEKIHFSLELMCLPVKRSAIDNVFDKSKQCFGMLVERGDEISDRFLHPLSGWYSSRHIGRVLLFVGKQTNASMRLPSLSKAASK